MKFQNFSLLFLSKLQNLDKLYGPFLWMGFNCLQDKSHFEEVVYFLPLSSQKLLVLILPTSEEWKVESNLEPPSGFEHGTPGWGIHKLLCK